MNDAQEIQALLSKLDKLVRERGIGRRRAAARIGVPYNTLKKWFSQTRQRMPSPENLTRLKSFLNSLQAAESEPRQAWGRVIEWWKTQHRYRTVADFAEEIGWETASLRDSLEKSLTPPRVVVEKVASLLSIPFGTQAIQLDLAERKTERIRFLLLLLEEELRWFRDGPLEARQMFRKNLDPMDIGYLSSLLAMLGEEEAFKRWLTLTTNRFNYFKLKGNENEPQSSN
jgi:hypothetical protein